MKLQSTLSNQISIQENISNKLTKQDTISDIRYQDITYYKKDRHECISPLDEIQIDFVKAVSEMEKLDWTFEDNRIVFTNKRTNETIMFVKEGEDKWYVEHPVFLDDVWSGYRWISHSDRKTISNLMNMFFEEMPWFGMISWIVRRSKKHARD